MGVPEPIRHAIDRFMFNWHAAWAEHGESEAGSANYRELVQSAREELSALGSADILPTKPPLYRALDALIFSRVLIRARPRGGPGPCRAAEGGLMNGSRRASRATPFRARFRPADLYPQRPAIRLDLAVRNAGAKPRTSPPSAARATG